MYKIAKIFLKIKQNRNNKIKISETKNSKRNLVEFNGLVQPKSENTKFEVVPMGKLRISSTKWPYQDEDMNLPSIHVKMLH